MPRSEDNTVHTSASIVRGLQSGDEDRWQEFYRLYAPVLRSFALKAVLTETEADEVVQETCIGVAKIIGEFHYEPKLCRFKSWLLNLASWRVKNSSSSASVGTSACTNQRASHSQVRVAWLRYPKVITNERPRSSVWPILPCKPSIRSGTKSGEPIFSTQRWKRFAHNTARPSFKSLT